MGVPTLTGKEITKRGKELEPIRKRAYEHFCINPLLTGGELHSILLSESVDVKIGTCDSWVSKWRWGHGKKEKVVIPINVKNYSWEQVIASAPNVETLGVLLLEGFMTKLKEKDDWIKTLEEDNRQLVADQKKLQSEFNERLAKAKIGTLTLDTIQHKLFKKE